MSGLISNSDTISSANTDDFNRDPVTGDITPKVATDSIVAQKIKTDLLHVLNTSDEVIAKIDGAGKIEGRSGEFGIIGAEFTKTAQTDFTAIGANVDTNVVDEFGNAYTASDNEFNFGNKNTNSTTPYIVTESDAIGGFEGWHLFDGTADSWLVSAPSNPSVVIDMGSSRLISSYEVDFSGTSVFVDRRVTAFILASSTDNVTFTDIDVVTGETTTGVKTYQIDTPIQGRYIRFTATAHNGGTALGLGELKLYEGVAATTNNTFDTRLATGTNGSFDPSSFLAYDEAAGLINGTGKINVAYAIDGGAFTSLVDQDTFKALGDIAYTSQFDIRLQLVGAQRFGSFKISQASGQTMQILSDGSVIASSGKFGLAGAISDQSVADTDFTAIGSNVDQTVADEFGNLIGGDGDVANGGTATASTTLAPYTASNAFSNNLSSVWVADSITSQTLRYTLSSPQLMAGFRMAQPLSSTRWATEFTVSIDGVQVGSWSGISYVAFQTWTDTLTFTPTLGTYLEISFVSGNSAGPSVAEVEIFTSATTDNTFDTNLASGTSGTFAPSSFLAYDETNTLISGAGKINVAYSVDGGAFTSPDSGTLPSAFDVTDYITQTTPDTCGRKLSDMGVSGSAVRLTKFRFGASNGSDTVKVFHGVQNGATWDLTEIASEGVTTVLGVENEIDIDVVVDGDNDIIVASVQGNGFLFRNNSSGGISYTNVAAVTGSVTAQSLSAGTLEMAMGVDYADDDQDTFKALGEITYTTQFDIRCQLVGSQRFSRFTISSPNTIMQVTSAGQVEILDSATPVSSFGTKGVAPVSLTTAERDALTGMVAGAMIYNETTNKLNFYNGTSWEAVTSA